MGESRKEEEGVGKRGWEWDIFLSVGRGGKEWVKVGRSGKELNKVSESSGKEWVKVGESGKEWYFFF